MHLLSPKTISAQKDFDTSELSRNSLGKELSMFLQNAANKIRELFKRILYWERWPFAVIYAPLSFTWVYYMLKARSVWFFSNVNPTLEFSGFEGESKKEMYEQLPSKIYPATLFVHHNENIISIHKKIDQKNIRYPFIVKPQVGMQAMLFRKIETSDQLNRYHNYVNVDYIIQEYIDLPIEVSVFHIRYPGKQKGMITGFILKDYLSVTGNGTSTLQKLIKEHPTAGYRSAEMKSKHAAFLNVVIPNDQKYLLSIAGNHNRGAKFNNLSDEIDERLCDVFDKISNDAGHFYFGRYDLKCLSVEDLKEGKNFCILEFNGVGAEPNHIYDCCMSYRDALRTIKTHWKHLYKISRINFKNGIPYWNFTKGLNYLVKAKKFFRKMRRADLVLPACP